MPSTTSNTTFTQNTNTMTQTNTMPTMPATTTATSKVVLSHPMSKAFAAAALASEKVAVTYKSEPTPAAEHKTRRLLKVTSGIYLSGINYADLPSVKAGIEDGSRGEVQSLSGAEWVLFPLVIRSLKSGKEQVRLTLSGEKSSTTYFVDGVAVSKEHFESFLVSSKRSSNRPFSQVFNVASENLISVSVA